MKKPPSAFAQAEDERVERVLSACSLTGPGIGAVIGTGIFVLTGTAAANHAGPALALSLIWTGSGALLYWLYGYRHSKLRAGG